MEPPEEGGPGLPAAAASGGGGELGLAPAELLGVSPARGGRLQEARKASAAKAREAAAIARTVANNCVLAGALYFPAISCKYVPHMRRLVK